MRRLAMTVVMMIAACGDDQPDVVDEKVLTPCEQLREHLIDLRLAEASPKVDKESHRVAMRAGFGDTFFSNCSQMNEGGRSCALSATTLTEAMGCNTGDVNGGRK